MKMLMLFLILYLCYLDRVNAVYCYWNTGCPYRFLSDKTPYNSARGDIRDGVVKLTGCEPVSIWGLARHGKINPGLELSSNMKDALVFKDYVVSGYDKGHSSLCAQDVDNLRTWNPDSKMFGSTHELSEEGYMDSLGIGTRLKQAFPNLLEKLNEGSYLFRPASGNYFEEYAKAFIEGLQNEKLVMDKVKDDYDIMIPYKHCEKYFKEVLNNPKTYLETKKYHESAEFQAMRDRLRRRLGMDNLLDDVNITALYDWCRYTWSGVENKISPWCALFTTEDLKVLEYAGDLKTYYQNGYGSGMNELFGRIPMADLLSRFQQVKEGNGTNIVMYFTENNMIEMVYTTLGLFKDKGPLTGARKIPDRKWRNSKLSPFSSNIMAVLNRCGSNDYNVVFYHNEEPLIPICKDGVCTWREFENKLKPFLNANADFC